MLLSLPLSSLFTKTTDVIPMGSKKEIKDPRSKEPQAAKDSGAAEARKRNKDQERREWAASAHSLPEDGGKDNISHQDNYNT